ncbi:MAG: DUF4124 domain-containing protein [Pseudomonadota bacterium]
MKSFAHHIGYLLLLPALLTTTASQAERLFKWVDEDGKVHYSDRVPPNHSQQERKEYNEQGRTIKVYERARTAEEKAEVKRQAALEEEKKKQAEKQAVHDRSLMATYSSEKDMMMARDGKLAAVDSLIQLTESRIKSTETRLREYAEEAADYERSGKPVPSMLQEQINTARELITDNREFVQEKKREREEIAARFNADITRYHELTESE